MCNKRFLHRLFLLLIAISLLALAIGSSPALAQDKVKITYWDWWVTQSPAIDTTIEQFMANHPNIEVEKRTIGGGPYAETLNLAFQGDAAPDVFLIPSTPSFEIQVSEGRFLALNTMPDFEAFKQTFPNPEDSFVEGINMIGGNVYAVSANLPLPWIQMYVNTALYKQAGIVNDDGSARLPTTLDEIIDNSRIIKEKTGKYGWGASGTQDWAFGWWIWICARSSSMFSIGGMDGLDAKTGTFIWNNDCTRKAIDGLLTLRDEKLVFPDMSVDDEGARAKFAEGEFAHLVAGDWVISGWGQTNPEFTDFDVINMPLVATDQPVTYFYTGPQAGAGDAFAINAKTQHPEAAWELFKALNSEALGENWAKEGIGMNLFTPGEPDEYFELQAWQSRYTMADTIISGPQPKLRNPDLAQLQIKLIGPDFNAILRGIFTGQIPADQIDVTLTDLDKRWTDALNLAIEDAQGAGAKVSLQDYIFPDWDPLKPYVTRPAGSQ